MVGPAANAGGPGTGSPQHAQRLWLAGGSPPPLATGRFSKHAPRTRTGGFPEQLVGQSVRRQQRSV
eukprot:8146353-Alexandrium_andersonii.AAC.1